MSKLKYPISIRPLSKDEGSGYLNVVGSWIRTKNKTQASY